MLQRGGSLERRASRRFSAYHFAKLANGESLKGLPEDTILPSNRNSLILPATEPDVSSHPDLLLPAARPSDSELAGTALTPGSIQSANKDLTHWQPVQHSSSSGSHPSEPEHSSKISLYLQYGRRIKKCLVAPSELKFPLLRRLLADKYSLSLSEDIPEIYIQDPQSGIKYKLNEEIVASDLKSGSILSLDLEPEGGVKKVIDDRMTVLTEQLIELNSKVTSNSESLKTLADSQKNMQDLKPTFLDHSSTHPPRPGTKYIAELRKDLATLKECSSLSLTDLRSSILSLVQKSQALQSTPILPPAGNLTNISMEHSFNKLSNDLDKLLTDVDELQDIIEVLRKDVTQRAVRPDLLTLQSVSKDLKLASKGLAAMDWFVLAEKNNWKKIWERDLDKILEEQQALKLHEDIVADLLDDLRKAKQTVEHIAQYPSSQSKLYAEVQSSRDLKLPSSIDSPAHAKNSATAETSVLAPTHKKHVGPTKPVAEKLRKKDFQVRGLVPEAFLVELDEFVGKANQERQQATEAKERKGKEKKTLVKVSEKEQKSVQ